VVLVSGQVVVVGGGAAGLCAAIAARSEGAQVVLVSKTPVGLANCTTYAGGGFTLAAGGMTLDEHRQVTWETGRLLPVPELLDALVTQAPALVARLRSYGVPYRERRGGISTAPFSRHPLLGGEVLTRALRDHASSLGVTLVSGHAVTALAVERERVVGMETLELRTGRAGYLPAGAVVLATGGGGRGYGRTDNPVRTTGDGYRLLYELGLPFQDMEFVQFYPLGLDEPGFPRWMLGLHLIDLVPLTNSRGERFLEPLLSAWGLSSGNEANLVARDRAALAVAGEYRQGRAVYLHLDEVPAERWAHPQLAYIARLYPRHRKPADGPVRVSPIQHYFSGGVCVDSVGQTAISGLYACGEVTGGVDGANRVGGNALTNCVVFGHRAGMAAAAGAHREGAVREPARTLERCQSWTRDEDGHAPSTLRLRLQRLADSRLGPIRDPEGLDAARSELHDLGDQLGRLRAGNARELAEAFEVAGLWTTLALVCAGATARRESRGVHFRVDYPVEDPAWQRSLRLVAGAGWPVVAGPGQPHPPAPGFRT